MDSTFFTYPRPKNQTQECPEDVEKIQVHEEAPCIHTEVLVPERDRESSCGPENDCREISPPLGDNRERGGVQSDSVDEAAVLTLQMSSSMLQHGS